MVEYRFTWFGICGGYAGSVTDIVSESRIGEQGSSWIKVSYIEVRPTRGWRESLSPSQEVRRTSESYKHLIWPMTCRCSEVNNHFTYGKCTFVFLSDIIMTLQIQYFGYRLSRLVYYSCFEDQCNMIVLGRISIYFELNFKLCWNHFLLKMIYQVIKINWNYFLQIIFLISSTFPATYFSWPWSMPTLSPLE